MRGDLVLGQAYLVLLTCAAAGNKAAIGTLGDILVDSVVVNGSVHRFVSNI